MTYNNPFYFALRRRSSISPTQAAAHIASEFKVSGTVEHVRSEEGFHLFRITRAAA